MLEEDDRKDCNGTEGLESVICLSGLMKFIGTRFARSSAQSLAGSWEMVVCDSLRKVGHLVEGRSACDGTLELVSASAGVCRW
jgi:hypothetical protein